MSICLRVDIFIDFSSQKTCTVTNILNNVYIVREILHGVCFPYLHDPVIQNVSDIGPKSHPSAIVFVDLERAFELANPIVTLNNYFEDYAL